MQVPQPRPVNHGASRPKAVNDPYQQLEFTNPSKGLNTLVSNNLIDDLESPSMMNVKFIEAGAPSKTDGYVQIGANTTNNPRGLGYFDDMPNSQKYLMTVDGANLLYTQTVGGTWSTLSGATFSTTGTITMTQVEGSMYIWDGVNGGAVVASGLSLSRPGTMPKAKFSIYWQGIHACAGVAGQESRLYMSAFPPDNYANGTVYYVGDYVIAPANGYLYQCILQTSGNPPPNATYWTQISTSPSSSGYGSSQFTNSSGTLSGTSGVPGASVFSGSGANFIDIQPNDADQITGLAIFQNELIIFKERSIYQMTIDDTGTPVVQQITQAYGCVSFKSISRVDNDVFFLTRNGFYVLGYEPNYFAVIRTNELSAVIHPIIETINPTNFTAATALFHQYVYYCGIPSSGGSANNITLTYDRRYQAWSQLNIIQPESLVVFVDGNNNEYIVFTSASTKQVFYITPNIYSAAGSAISSYWFSKSYDTGDFNVFKRWVDCTILFRQITGTVNVTFYQDNGTITNTFSVNTLSSIGIGSDVFGAPFFGGDISTNNTSTLPATNNIPLRFHLSVKSRTMQVEVSNSNLNENFVVLGIAFRYRPYSPFSWPSNLKVY